MIRPIEAKDAAACCDIYNHYIEHTIVTFEEVPIDAGEMRHRIDTITASHPWLVFEDSGGIAGYAYAGPWKMRHAYRFSAESTVYLAPDRHRRGTGTALYKALLPALRDISVRAVMAGIALPNDASIALHEKVGFEKVAHFREVGWKFERWIDVAYWECVMS